MRRLLVLAQVKEPSHYDPDARQTEKAEKAPANRAKLVAMVSRS